MSRRLFLFFCLAVFLFVTIYSLLGPLSRISVVELNLEGESSSAAKPGLEKALRSLEGRLAWKIDLKQTAHQVSTFYPGARVQVLRRLPGRLLLFVQKRAPVFLLYKEGGFYPVSQEGDIGPVRKKGESLDFPILRGPDLTAAQDLRRQALLVFLSLPREGDSLLSQERLSEIVYRPSTQAFLFYVSGFVLELTKPLSEKKARRIDFVLRYLLQKGRQRALVSARQNAKIIVKKPPIDSPPDRLGSIEGLKSSPKSSPPSDSKIADRP